MHKQAFSSGLAVRMLAGLMLASACATGRAGGNYLVVTPPDFDGSAPLTQFIAGKTSLGFDVSTYVVPAGTGRDQIRAQIKSLWLTPDAPDYILLIGDTDGSVSTANTIPHWEGGGTRAASTDLPYACMDEPDDWYPDAYLGRFSVRTIDQLQAVVDKSLFVEAGGLTDPNYVKRVALLATDDMASGGEEIHNWVTDNCLAPAGVGVTKIYARQGGGTSDIHFAVSSGRLITVYFGHSTSSGWWSPYFSQSNVNQLTNGDRYGLVYGFSCNTAHYSYDECLGETWLRAENKGAAAYLSASTYIYYQQTPWHESQNLHRYFMQAMYEDDVWEVGPAWQRALYGLLDHYGATDTTRNHFEMFVLLGDPALRLPGKASAAGTVQLDRPVYGCDVPALIQVNDFHLNADPLVAETVPVTISSDSEPGGEAVLLTETGPCTYEFEAAIPLTTVDAAGELLVAPGDTITVTYADDDDGTGQSAPVTATAVVECTPPVPFEVGLLTVAPDSASVICNVDQSVWATLRYGTQCDALSQSVASHDATTFHLISLAGLAPNTRYYYEIELEDEAGNVSIVDNNGDCLTFRTRPPRELIYEFPLDTSPGWTTQGQWEFGVPAGQGGAHGFPDPTSGATGANVYGVNLDGDYSTYAGGPYLLTAGPLDFSGISHVELSFARWLNTDNDPYTRTWVESSKDNTRWRLAWANGAREVLDGTWTPLEYDLSLPADGESAVRVRWGYQTGGGAASCSGWNVDDVEFWGVRDRPTGDLNCDGSVNAGDIDAFVLAITSAPPNDQPYYDAYPACDRGLADCNADGLINAGDIDAFVVLLTRS